MREQKVLPKEFEFYFSDLDNMVFVESLDDENVRIRFTRNNLSEKRRASFVRMLAAEGFIPEHFQWYSVSIFASHGITWEHDCSWVTLPAAVIRRSNRFMKLLIAGACLLWLAMMRVVIVSPQHPMASAKTPGVLVVSSLPSDSMVERKDIATDSLVPR